MQFYLGETKPILLPAQLTCLGALEQQGKDTSELSPCGASPAGINPAGINEITILTWSWDLPPTDTSPGKSQAELQITAFLFPVLSLNIRQAFHASVLGYLSKDMESESSQINHCIFRYGK